MYSPMRIFVIFLVSVAYVGCSASVPSTEDVQLEMEKRLTAEANDCLRLVGLEKTNGYESPTLAGTYVVQFDVEVEFLRECKWKVDSMRKGQHNSFETSETDEQARQRGGSWAQFRNNFENVGDSYTKGTRVKLQGEQGFLNTEKGFQPASDLLSMTETASVKSEKELQGVTAHMLASINHAIVERSKIGINIDATGVFQAAAESDMDLRLGLEAMLVPYIIKALPDKDAWGHQIEYLLVGQTAYARSPGSDGKFTFEPKEAREWPEMETYPDDAYEGDLVIHVAGYGAGFAYGPECLSSWLCDW